MRRLDIETGTQFGLLQIVAEIEAAYRRPGKIARRFICACRCGGTKEAFLEDLRSGVILTCGCRSTEANQAARKANIRQAHAKQRINDGLNIHQRYRKRHPEKVQEARAKWRSANPEKVLAMSRRNYTTNAEKRRTSAMVYYHKVKKPKHKTDEYRERARVNTQNRRRLCDGKVSKKEWTEILTEHGNRCVYCGDAGKLTMDHVIPISKGGLHERSNIVPACGRCNSSKGNRYTFPPIARKIA